MFEMDDSGFQKSIGCSSNVAVRNASLIQLSKLECRLIEFTVCVSTFFGLVGCAIHAYIIFCYHFKRYESRVPIQTLIVALSFYDLFYCSGVLVLFVVYEVPGYSDNVECPIVSTITSFYRNSLYIVVLLLTCNRFFAVCRPRQYEAVFSSRRIVIYSSSIFTVSLLVALVGQFEKCYLQQKLHVLGNVYNYVALAFYVLFNPPIMGTIVVLYIRIRNRLRRHIRQDEFFDLVAEGALSEDLKVERSYLKAITVSCAITLPLLVIDFGINVCSSLMQFSSDPSGKVARLEYTVTLVFASSLTLLFVVNPFIFYTTNEDFRIKLIRPCRSIKATVDSEATFKVAELNTHANIS